MGRVLLRLNLLPDQIVSSPAERARQTARLAAKECGYDRDIRLESLLYGRGVDGYTEALRSLPDGVRQPLLVGHNPELEELTGLLGAGVHVRIPTAGLVCLQAPIESWKDLKPGVCVLQWFLIPEIVKALR
jgi:phosphohistidine phosphatase